LSTNRTPSIQRVLIVGGTHGNELTGAYIIKKLERCPEQVRRSTFETVTLLANPKAFAAVRRYVDTDLNRCFRRIDLQDLSRCSYEEIRAREINSLFGANGRTPADVILDLHSTTANMGLTIITNEHPFNFQLAAYLQSVYPLVKVQMLPKLDQNSSGLPSICELGCTIEVGPVAQGVLQAEQFQQTEALLEATLDYLEHYNQRKTPSFNSSLTVYRRIGVLDYPRSASGEIQVMIHPDLHAKNYHPLHPGDPVFLTFEGEVFPYSGSSTVYPIFINEAAYYEKGIAMYITHKQQIDLKHQI
jgi:succinylglutamate desuccinylase